MHFEELTQISFTYCNYAGRERWRRGQPDTTPQYKHSNLYTLQNTKSLDSSRLGDGLLPVVLLQPRGPSGMSEMSEYRLLES